MGHGLHGFLAIGIPHEPTDGLQILRWSVERDIAARGQRETRILSDRQALGRVLLGVGDLPQQQDRGQLQITAKADSLLAANVADKVERDVLINTDVLRSRLAHHFHVLLGMPADEERTQALTLMNRFEDRVTYGVTNSTNWSEPIWLVIGSTTAITSQPASR